MVNIFFSKNTCTVHVIAPITLKLNNLKSVFPLQTVLLYVLLTDLQNLYPIINMC